MIRIQDTKNMIGITIHGDYEDLKALYNSLSDYLRIYFDHQEGSAAYSCYETILGLCYDIRHAFQGDRNIETVENNHENIAQLAQNIYQLDNKAIQKERNRYKNGNLYFNVEILYPWAVYYLYALQAITEDYYQTEWFENDEFGYTEYQAEKDLSLIRYFVQLLWEKLRENLPEEVMDVLWEYTRMYNHVEYYFDISDLYMEWFCTYWVKAGSCRERRMELLPLLCLELSSVTDEDEDDLEEMIEPAGTIDQPDQENQNNSHIPAQAHPANKTVSDENAGDNIPVTDIDKTAAFDEKVRKLEASIAQNTLRALQLYDEYAENWYEIDLPYQSMDEFSFLVYTHVQKHGPFSEEGFEDWLDQIVGFVDWDGMEW